MTTSPWAVLYLSAQLALSESWRLQITAYGRGCVKTHRGRCQF
jgi:hypothetical protein